MMADRFNLSRVARLKTRVCEPYGSVKELPVDWFIMFLRMSDTLAMTGLREGGDLKRNVSRRCK